MSEGAKGGVQGATPALAVQPAVDYAHPPSAVFLAELRFRARKYGWSGDYTELTDFLRELYAEAGLPVPNLEPFPVMDGEK